MDTKSKSVEEMQEELNKLPFEVKLNLDQLNTEPGFAEYVFNSIMESWQEFQKEKNEKKKTLLSNEGIKFVKRGKQEHIVFNQNTLEELQLCGKAASIYFKDDALLIAVYNDPLKCHFKLDSLVVKRMKKKEKANIIEKLFTLKNEEIALDLKLERFTKADSVEQMVFMPVEEGGVLKKENVTLFKVAL